MWRVSRSPNPLRQRYYRLRGDPEHHRLLPKRGTVGSKRAPTESTWQFGQSMLVAVCLSAGDMYVQTRTMCAGRWSRGRGAEEQGGRASVGRGGAEGQIAMRAGVAE